jgi:WD40 repeat protein
MRRGWGLPASLVAAELSHQAAKAAITASRISALAEAAMAFTGVKMTAGAVITPQAARLAEGVLKSMVAAKFKTVIVLALAATIAGSAVGMFAYPTPLENAPQVQAKVERKTAEQKDNQRKSAKEQQASPDQDYPLPPGAIVRLGTTRLRHGDDIGFLGFSADGKTIVACGGDYTRIWDAATGKLVQRFPKESAVSVGHGAVLSPDRKWLVTAGPKHPDNETLLHIWETATAKPIATLDTEKLEGAFPGRRFGGICFSPDGKFLASRDGMGLNEITLWDFPSARKRKGWITGKEPVTSFAITGDGKILVTASRDHTVRFWDVETLKEQRQISVGTLFPQELAVSPDGALLAVLMVHERVEGPIALGGGQAITTYQEKGTIGIWDLASGKKLCQILDPEQKKDAGDRWGFESLAFLPNSQEILAGSGGGSLYVCDVTGATRPRRVWQSSTKHSWVIAASPEGKRVAVAIDVAIHLIDLATGKDVVRLAGHPSSAYKTAVTPDGRLVLTASGSDLFLWDAASGRLRQRLPGHHEYINGLKIFDSGRKAITSAYQDGSLRIWDLIAEKEIGRIESSDKANILQAVSPDGKTIAVGGSGSVVVLFDLHTGKEIQRLKKKDDEFNVYGAAFTPDSRMLVVWYSADNIVYHWDLTSGKKVREYTFLDQEDPTRAAPPAVGGRPVYVAAVSPDGRIVAFGSQSRFLEVRDLATGELLHRLTKLPDGVCPLAFSPDSRMLAWSGWWNDPTVHLIEVATGQERQRFAGHTGRVLSLSFSADGTALISGSADTTAIIWDLTGRLTRSEVPDKSLAAADLETCWNNLAEEDAAKAYRMIQKLAASPKQAVFFLRSRLGPASAIDEKRIARLIAELDSNQFAVRETAEKELEKYGELAFDLLRKALEGKPSLETRRRLERLTEGLSGGLWSKLSLPRVRALRAVEVLERIGTPEAEGLLESLARGAPEARLTKEAKASLVRLAKRHVAKP